MNSIKWSGRIFPLLATIALSASVIVIGGVSGLRALVILSFCGFGAHFFAERVARHHSAWWRPLQIASLLGANARTVVVIAVAFLHGADAVASLLSRMVAALVCFWVMTYVLGRRLSVYIEQQRNPQE